MNSGVFTIPLIGRDDAARSPVGSNDRLAGSTAYIAGPENELLRPFLELATTTPPLFHPITLLGPTGVGKSHLAVGLVQRVKRAADQQVALFTGADFARGYARAVEVDSISEWRDRLRRLELLVIDNLEEMASKPAAQQELIGTLDAFLEQDRLIVFTTRESLFDWNWMLPGLRSRILGGLTIPIAYPAPETQEAIWRELRRSYGLDAVEPATPGDGASRSRSRARQRTPAKPRTFQQLRRRLWAELQATARIDQGSTQPTRPHPSPVSDLSLAKIAKTVARHCQIRLGDLSGPSRRQTLVQARGLVIVLARTLLSSSFEEIGVHLGGRDHTTILHSWRKTTEMVRDNPALANDLEKLSRQLTSNFEIELESSN